MSGFSYSGGQPRCFAFWQEFQKCYASADIPTQCRLQGEDYLECLHGKKAAARQAKVAAEAAKLTKEDVQQRLQPESRSVGVGLIEDGGDKP
ncbi:hypothetical protein CPB85DRAFT_1304298 [Mucidula mucida]|nr:hypothetical protein CPB85DRAFT_1304298 [Mucidula mucida]